MRFVMTYHNGVTGFKCAVCFVAAHYLSACICPRLWGLGLRFNLVRWGCVADARNSTTLYKRGRVGRGACTMSVFTTEGHGMYLRSGFKTAKDMQTDDALFDEVSGELCRHTPNPACLSSLCLFEVKKDMPIISKCYSHPQQSVVACQKMLFNACIMMPGSKKKDKVQVHLCKIGDTPIMLPTDRDSDYTVVVRAKEMSHYVTRVGMLYKIMLYIEDCTLCTIYQAPASKFPTVFQDIHHSIFAGQHSFAADVYQKIETIKITIGTISVDRYCEKFMATMLFQVVPVPVQTQYMDARTAQGPRLVCSDITCNTLSCNTLQHKPLLPRPPRSGS